MSPLQYGANRYDNQDLDISQAQQISIDAKLDQKDDLTRNGNGLNQRGQMTDDQAKKHQRRMSSDQKSEQNQFGYPGANVASQMSLHAPEVSMYLIAQ